MFSFKSPKFSKLCILSIRLIYLTGYLIFPIVCLWGALNLICPKYHKKGISLASQLGHLFLGVRVIMRTMKFYCGIAFDLHKPRQAFLLNENMILACGKWIGFRKTETSSLVQWKLYLHFYNIQGCLQWPHISWRDKSEILTLEIINREPISVKGGINMVQVNIPRNP